MNSLTINSRAAKAMDRPAQPSLAGRLSALYHRIIDTCPVHVEASAGSLADLNDETLLDLGVDPASFRHMPTPADPKARIYY